MYSKYKNIKNKILQVLSDEKSMDEVVSILQNLPECKFCINKLNNILIQQKKTGTIHNTHNKYQE